MKFIFGFSIVNSLLLVKNNIDESMKIFIN